MLDFRIYTFLEVCKTLNYTKAAQNLNITQPAVSQHIRYLEEYYGLKLFQTGGKKIHLTDSGRMLKQSLSAMVHDEIYMKQMLKDSSKESQALSFGVTKTVGEYAITDSLAAYILKHPGLTVRMEEDNTQGLLDRLSENQIDFAIVEGYFSKSDYNHLVYSKEKFIAVCGMEYPVPKKRMAIEELFSYDLIVREAGSGTRSILEKALEEKNYSLGDFNSRQEISSIHVIKSLVEKNCGITFLYEKAVEEELRNGTLRRIPLKEFDIVHDFTFLWKRGSIFSDYYKEMYDVLAH